MLGHPLCSDGTLPVAGACVESQHAATRRPVWRSVLRHGLALALIWTSLLPARTTSADTYKETIYPLLETHCLRCHGEKRKKAGVDLSVFKHADQVLRDPKLWEKILRQLEERSMPPEEEPTPAAEEFDRLIQWISHTLDNPPPDLVPLDPGQKPIHRLGRTEYNNTLRDLLGTTNRPADRFPADGGGGGGFDNNADTLFVPPILLERLVETAAEALDKAPVEKLFINQPVWYTSARLSARQNIRWFARRAFRRPVAEAEVQRLVALYDRTRDSGRNHDESIRLVYKAILVSPHFLFRVEVDPPGKSPGRISDSELAVRLSYFLWSSMPDEELIQQAEQGELGRPDVLEAQVRRMLRDPKAKALAENFAGQWFGVRSLFTSAQPNHNRFPEYTESLRDAMAAEPVEFFHHMVQANRPLTDLLDADYAFVNRELANHYGVTPPAGDNVVKVSLRPEDRNQGRGGLLGMGAVLVQTSYPQRSSPVLRGKWILEEVLGTPPPPPPPLVKTLSPDDKPQDGLTFRQRLEAHRQNPTCAACHQRMDPLGFALENLGPTGKWRTQIGGEEVDAKGVLSGGEYVDGPAALKQALLVRKQLFLRHTTEKMLAYALGRGLEYYDMPLVKRIADSLATGDAPTVTLILEIVKSFPFQHRRGTDMAGQ